MSKILIVPDCHGRTFWRKALKLIDKVDKVVFLGDYLDPYPQEGINFEEAITEFIRILQFKESYPDKVILLIGNHDCGYIWKEFPDPSRRNYTHLDAMNELFNNNIDKFQLIYQYEDYLFSHAGVYEEWMNMCKFTLEDLENFDFINNWPSLSCVGYARGGYYPVGSCVWADIRESVENKLYSDKQQIVGHTQLKDFPYGNDKIVCIDVRSCFILNTETNELKEVSETLNLETKS